MIDIGGFKGVFEPRKGNELMVWTSGGHYFRGNLEGVEDPGFLVLRDVSCTLAGERQEREVVYIALHAIDAASWE